MEYVSDFPLIEHLYNSHQEFPLWGILKAQEADSLIWIIAL